MKISVRNLEPTKVKLTVTVEPEELNPYLDAARKEIAKQVNVPGFRKGHVPGKIIDQRIGFAAVAGEAVNDAVPELYSKALDEKKIRPMAQPELSLIHIFHRRDAGLLRRHRLRTGSRHGGRRMRRRERLGHLHALHVLLRWFQRRRR